MIFVVLRCFLGFCPGLCAIKEVSQTNSCLICDSNSFEALRFLTLSPQKRCPQEFEAPRCRGLRSLRKDPGCQWQKRIINGDDKSKKIGKFYMGLEWENMGTSPMRDVPAR